MNLAGSFRFAIAAGLIASTALLLQARGRTEIVPQHLPLSSFPEQLGNWNGTDIALDKDTLAVLGNGDFMERVYQALRAICPPSISFWHTLPASEPETQFTLRKTVFLEPDGTPNKNNGSPWPCRGTRRFPRIAM